jgi:hypothetical protein
VAATGYISKHAGNRLRKEKEKKDNYRGQTETDDCCLALPRPTAHTEVNLEET